MSHFTTIKTQIKDIEALKAACTELNLSVLEKAQARGYYENKTRGDFVIKLKGPYDIAVQKQPDGTFGLTADLYAGQVEEEVGQDYGNWISRHKVRSQLDKHLHDFRMTTPHNLHEVDRLRIPSKPEEQLQEPNVFAMDSQPERVAVRGSAMPKEDLNQTVKALVHRNPNGC
jgi:hypothetical protein